MYKKILPLVILLVAIIGLTIYLIQRNKPELADNTSNLTCSTVKFNALLSIRHEKDLGNFYGDGFCMALYTYKLDKPYESTCYDACTQNWKPYLVGTRDPSLETDNLAKQLTVVVRRDGTKQFVIDGKPLYKYAGDAVLTDAKGHNLENGNWKVLNTNIVAEPEPNAPYIPLK